MLQVLSRSQHALRTQAARHVSRHGVKGLLSLQQLVTRNLRFTSHLQQDGSVAHKTDTLEAAIRVKPERKVPVFCPGCGAPSQTVDSSSAGFYGTKHVRQQDQRRKQEDAVFAAALEGDGHGIAQWEERPKVEQGTPVCDRCHNLQYQSSGRSIVHPSTDSIRAIIDESPHRYNNIYHVIDAADFPMSMIPNLTTALHLPRLRTRNRRSKATRYSRDRVAEVNFIITRSDLLAPQKEQVDKLLPYVQDVLRDALGRTRKNVRLGNVRLVSAKRGWWTKTLKEEIYRRGGGGWMVGKVNVGKSALVEAVFPKGRLDVNIRKLYESAKADREVIEEPEPDFPVISSQSPEVVAIAPPTKPYQGQDLESDSLIDDVTDTDLVTAQPGHQDDVSPIGARANESLEDIPTSPQDALSSFDTSSQDDEFVFDESDPSLLPIAQPEVAYPTMPIVSALPGTTASPIRLPFGNGKGELIDLPGIQRSALEQYVREESRKEMIMKHRIVPEQHTVKPGQSLLLGGLIRITPRTEDVVFLMYGFLPTALAPHVTSTDKAVAIQTGSFTTGEAYEGHVISNATDPARLSIKSAGSYKLRWDVTKQRAGPVTDKGAGKQKASTLPFVVYALDLLVEGVGWVEVVAQVRRKRFEQVDPIDDQDPFREDETTRDESDLPEIEVFSPQGQFIGIRRPMNGWVLGGPKKTPVHKQKARPRQSMSYQRRVQGGKQGSLRKATLNL